MVFFEEVVCQVIRWGRNGVESHSQPVISGRHLSDVAVKCILWLLWFPPKTQAVMESVRYVPRKVLHHHCQQRKSPWKGFALSTYDHDNQGLHITKDILTLCPCCCSGEDVYVPTALISSCRRKVVVSRRVTSRHFFPASQQQGPSCRPEFQLRASLWINKTKFPAF